MQYYVVDAFTDTLFRGNPAGVCLLERAIPDSLMQRIAFENNLAETAFVLPQADGYRLRWFTPEVEIDLCGHATLASAHVLLSEVHPEATEVGFQTVSGPLTVVRQGDHYVMDFPSRMPRPVPTPPLLARALGCEVLETHLSRDLMAVVPDQAAVAGLSVDAGLLSQISQDVAFGVIVTAVGEGCDFVSRFFAPNAGVQEDPVTGSAHSTLIPFWGKRLGRARLLARQLSPRGGVLTCEDCGERVRIGGQAVCYLRGDLLL